MVEGILFFFLDSGSGLRLLAVFSIQRMFLKIINNLDTASVVEFLAL